MGVCSSCRTDGWYANITQDPKHAIIKSDRPSPRGTIRLMAFPSANPSDRASGRYLWSVFNPHYAMGIRQMYHLPFPDQGVASNQRDAMRKAEETYLRFIKIEER